MRVVDNGAKTWSGDWFERGPLCDRLRHLFNLSKNQREKKEYILFNYFKSTCYLIIFSFYLFMNMSILKWCVRIVVTCDHLRLPFKSDSFGRSVQRHTHSTYRPKSQ